MARAATLGKPKEETYVDYSLIFVVLFLLSFGLRVEFYSKLVGTFHDSGFKFNTWYDMIWMEKYLGQHTTSPAPVRFGQWTLES